MNSKTLLKLVFSCIFLSLAVYSAWASLRQPLTQWGGLAGPDRYWTGATLLDAYYGFITFYVWVFYKEMRWLPRAVWLLAILLLGNMAMSSYVLLQLFRLAPDRPAADILAARNP